MAYQDCVHYNGSFAGVCRIMVLLHSIQKDSGESMMIKNNRGVAPVLVVIGVSVLLIIVTYLILLLPIPAFTYIRSQVLYFLVLAIWILIQYAIIYGFWRLYKFITQGVKEYKKQLLQWDSKIQNWLMLQ